MSDEMQSPAGRPGSAGASSCAKTPTQSSQIDVLLQRLEGVQKTGSGFRARCPNCGGAARTLSICGTASGSILLHCFACGDALKVLQTIGLTFADLYPGRNVIALSPGERRAAVCAARQAQWASALIVLSAEARVVAIAGAELQSGRPLSDDDADRLDVAVRRIDAARDVLCDDRAKWRPEMRS